MIAKGTGEECTLAPLFSALGDRGRVPGHAARSATPGQRLDPPLLLCLDEVTQICPVPVPAWAADAGGQGVQLCLGFHGLAQLKSRWGIHGAQTVLDTCGCKIVTPGISDDELLRQLSSLCGQVSYRERGRETRLTWHDVMTIGMLRQLPPQFMVIIRGAYAPVVAKLARGWRHPKYRRLASVAAAPPRPSELHDPTPLRAHPHARAATAARRRGRAGLDRVARSARQLPVLTRRRRQCLTTTTCTGCPTPDPLPAALLAIADHAEQLTDLGTADSTTSAHGCWRSSSVSTTSRTGPGTTRSPRRGGGCSRPRRRRRRWTGSRPGSTRSTCHVVRSPGPDARPVLA